jgi:chemotaxis protein MotB
MNRKKKAEAPKAGAPLWMTSWADMVSLLMCFFVMLFALSSVDEVRWASFADAMQANRFFLSAGGGTPSPTEAMGGTNILPYQQNLIPPIVSQDEPAPTPTPTPIPPGDPDDPGQAHSARMLQVFAMAESFQMYMEDYQFSELIGLSVSELGYMRITFPNHMMFNSGSDELLPEAIDLIDYFAGWLADYPGHQVTIQGHTDDRPINTPQFRSNMHLSAGRAISVFNRLVGVHGFDPFYIATGGMGEHLPIDTNDTIEGRAANRRVEIVIHVPQYELMGQTQRPQFDLMGQ